MNRYEYCDKYKVTSGMMNGNEERRSGTRNEDPERGTRIWDGVQDTLQPCVNSVISPGNEDPPCVHMGGRVTLYLDV